MMTKTVDELLPIVEGVLFAATEPLSVDAIIKYFVNEAKPKSQDIKKALVQLKSHYQERGIELVEVASGYRFQVSQPVLPYLEKSAEEKPARFSKALMETLALIAYRQPITRGEIEAVRGVVVSSNIVKTLEEFGWVKVVGYKEVPGKPGLYATTKAFLDYFGLKSLSDLPPLAQLADFESLTNSVNEEPPMSNSVALDIELATAELEEPEELEEKSDNALAESIS
ncbi:MAG: SMC-Scp complex subunit ScpB [Proteobacteria bacterium]|nr:SMC-Scp complex subunit ScpB [Pseudomonadota bacterium]